ncbi:MAG: GGDEF domain-containing protein [Paraglaciecola sp.]|nr:GGDEF domain-containing protein [Paraglaciecola sp.]
MNESQYYKKKVNHPTVEEVNVESLSADLIQIRCEFVVNHQIWLEQHEQLEQDNQLLLLSLFQLLNQNANAQNRIRQLVIDNQCDVLTQTLNRNIMLDRITHAISLAKRQHNRLAILFIDLDHFKPINDRLGHGAGDTVLQEVSTRLTATIRESDAISRHGGDEFLILLNDVKHIEDAKAFAAKLVDILKRPYQLTTGQVTLSGSVGIAIYPDDAENVAALINAADAAMYRAKKQGGGRVGYTQNGNVIIHV